MADPLRVIVCVPVVSLPALVRELVRTVRTMVARWSKSYGPPVRREVALRMGSSVTWNEVTPLSRTLVWAPTTARRRWLAGS